MLASGTKRGAASEVACECSGHMHRQDHYPERLGRAILVNPPVQVIALWRSPHALLPRRRPLVRRRKLHR